MFVYKKGGLNNSKKIMCCTCTIRHDTIRYKSLTWTQKLSVISLI